MSRDLVGQDGAGLSPPLTLAQAAALPGPAVLAALGVPETGWTEEEAARRLAVEGPNVLPGHRATAWRVLVRQFANPVLLLLLIAAGLSFATGDPGNAVIIGVIMAASTGLGFVNEYRAERTAQDLHRQHCTTSSRAGPVIFRRAMDTVAQCPRPPTCARSAVTSGACRACSVGHHGDRRHPCLPAHPSGCSRHRPAQQRATDDDGHVQQHSGFCQTKGLHGFRLRKTSRTSGRTRVRGPPARHRRTPVSVLRPRGWHGDPTGSHVVLGVQLSQDPRVVVAAASLTHRMGASLTCVWVDPQRVVVERGPDGAVVALPLESHRGDDEQTASSEQWLAARLANTLEGHPVPWRFVYTAGDPAQQLHQLAEELDAVAIALGTRAAGFRAWITEKAVGSVAEHLAHHQHPPVLPVPLPIAAGTGHRQ